MRLSSDGRSVGRGCPHYQSRDRIMSSVCISGHVKGFCRHFPGKRACGSVSGRRGLGPLSGDQARAEKSQEGSVPKPRVGQGN